MICTHTYIHNIIQTHFHLVRMYFASLHNKKNEVRGEEFYGFLFFRMLRGASYTYFSYALHNFYFISPRFMCFVYSLLYDDFFLGSLVDFVGETHIYRKI